MQSIFLPNDEEEFFTTNANDRAYYFVEVVTEQGPSPIYFVADRDSWLGSPAVVVSTARTTSIQLKMEALSEFPTNRARHVFGPREEARFVFSPDSMRSMVKIEKLDDMEIPDNKI